MLLLLLLLLLLLILILRATRGARNPNFFLCMESSLFGLPLKINGMHRTQSDI